MNRMTYALAVAAITALVAGSAQAASTSAELTVTVTVVPPGSLGNPGGQSAPPDRGTTEQPAPTTPAPDAAPADN